MDVKVTEDPHGSQSIFYISSSSSSPHHVALAISYIYPLLSIPRITIPDCWIFDYLMLSTSWQTTRNTHGNVHLGCVEPNHNSFTAITNSASSNSQISQEQAWKRLIDELMNSWRHCKLFNSFTSAHSPQIFHQCHKTSYTDIELCTQSVLLHLHCKSSSQNRSWRLHSSPYKFYSIHHVTTVTCVLASMKTRQTIPPDCAHETLSVTMNHLTIYLTDGKTIWPSSRQTN